MLFAACSSDKDVAEGPQTTGIGEGYLALSINLPTAPQSIMRAKDNADGVELDDGLNSEYQVKDAILIVFSKPTTHNIEGDQSATFKAAYSIIDQTTPWSKDSDPQVTEVSRRIIQKVDASKVEVGSLMLVVLNTNGKLAINGTDGLTVNGSEFTGTFANLQALMYNTIDAKSYMWNNGFFMSNATLSRLKGSTTTSIDYDKEAYQNLVAVDQIYESEQAAQSATNVPQIYVARGMAKVTLSASTTGTDREMEAKVGTTKLLTTVEGWVLDNTNKKSYIVPSLAGIKDFTTLHSNITGGVYRFTGNTAITTGTPAFPYRTYFAKDPNYTGSYTLDDEFNILTTTDLDWTSATKKYATTFGSDNPQYCFENTFDVDGQIEQKTTVARLAVSVKQDGESAVDLFVVNGNKSAPVLEADAETIFKNAVLKYIEDKGKSTYVASGQTLEASDITVGLTTTAGKVTFTAATSDATTKLKTAGQNLLTDLDETNTAMLSDLNNGTNYVNVIRYKDGISYYTVRIKHFGADGAQTNNKLCPWKAGEKVGGKEPSSINGVYPAGTERDDNYLGRYGVLRNNWYDISIGKIKGLGDATPQALSTVTDDEIDSYIAFQINVLSWAKRTQSWSF